VVICAFCTLACRRAPTPSPQFQEITLYTAVDEPVARPIVAQFEQSTGIHVNLVPDTEASKTAGLADRLEAEKANPHADVWWSNEPFHTIHLADAEVLAEYESPSAAAIPAEYKDAAHRWAGTALRIRVIAATPKVAAKITGVEDLTKPEFRGRIGMARPGIGTVGGHVAALYAVWGDDKADAFFRALRDNRLTLLGGNSVVADTVGDGRFDAGLTDNDDCDNALHEGGSLVAVLPDQSSIGILAIPCTVALVRGAPHPDPAKKLIDYLLSPEVEDKLRAAGFSKYSVFSPPPPQVRFMKVDYPAVAKSMPRAIARAAAILESR
jgi:iron(III) transport system substrate-binding protein